MKKKVWFGDTYLLVAATGFPFILFSAFIWIIWVALGGFGPYSPLAAFIDALLLLAFVMQFSAIDKLRYVEYERGVNIAQTVSLFSASTYVFGILGTLYLAWPNIDIIIVSALLVFGYGAVSSILAAVEIRKMMLWRSPGGIR